MTNLSEFRDSFMDHFSDDQKVVVRRTRSIVQVLIVTAMMFGGGGTVGYWVRDHIAQQRRAVMEEMHRQDLAARDKIYSDSLALLTKTLERVTGKVEQTVEQVGAIAQTTEVAADQAKKAADAARKAAANTTAMPSVTRDQVNRSVERANKGGSP